MAKKKARTQGRVRGQKMTPSKRKAKTPRGKARRKTARKSAARKVTGGAARKGTRKRATSKTGTRTAPRKGGRSSRKAASRASSSRTSSVSRKRTGAASRKRTAAPSRKGGSGREETLSQTPESGRSVRGRTNPMATRRSTGTAAGAGGTRHAPGLLRERKQLRELEETIQGPPSSLDMDRNASAARSGRRHFQGTLEDHNETSPALTGGDVDADWEDAYAVGDEAPGGDNPTPDQDRVDDIGKALGVTYEDNEELKASDKIAERDKHRWELDPASSDDYRDRE